MSRLTNNLAAIKRYYPWIIIILLSFTPLIWFYNKGDVLINGIDTNFPLNPLVWFERRFFVWNNLLNGGVDFSSSTAGLFFHLVQVVPYLMGFNLQAVQIFSLVFWFALINLSAFLFIRTIIPRRFLWQLLFIVFYSFNIYLFNSWENVKVANLSLVAAIPLVLAIITLLRENKLTLRQSLLPSALTGLVASGTGINPSYFVTFCLVLLLYWLGLLISEKNAKGILSRIRDLVVVVLIIFLVNSFWLHPTISLVSKSVNPTASLTQIGFNNWTDSLSENTSLMNVLRMQGAWDWYAFDDLTGFPLYIPYALNYFYRLPFLIFSFLIPFLAILSLLLINKTKNYLYLSFSLMLVLGVFLSAGTHPPTGNIFRWLLNNVPFFSLFRSPWYIFAPLVGLSTAGLVTLLFDSMEQKLANDQFWMAKYFVRSLSIILIIGNFLYCYPLITGKIFRPARKDGFYVHFPDYLFQARKWLDEKEPNGRIIEYPDNEIIEFSWGYRGIESILGLFSRWESLFPPLNASNSGIAKIIKRYYLTLKRGSMEASQNLAYKLGASYLFEKKDVSSLAPTLPSQIQQLPGTSFAGKWNFFKLFTQPTPKVYSSNIFYFGQPFERVDETIETVLPSALVFNKQDTEIGGINQLTEDTGWIVLADNLQTKDLYDFAYAPSNLSYRLIGRDLGKVEYEFEIQEDGLYQPLLEQYRLEDFGLSAQEDLKVLIDNQETILKFNRMDDSYVYYEKSILKKGNHRLVIKLDKRNLVIGGNFQNAMQFKEGGYGEGKAIYEIQGDDSQRYLTISNYQKADVWAEFEISPFDPLGFYYIELRYKQIYGNNALVLAGQNNQTTLIKTQQERLPNYPEWGVFSFYYMPVVTDSIMKVILSAPYTKDPLGTKINYDDLIVYKVFSNNLVFVKDGDRSIVVPEIEYKKISPVEYQVTVRKAKGPHVLVFLENYSPEWEIKLIKQNNPETIIKHFSVNSYANGWYLDKTPDDYQVKIYYRRQRQFILGLGASALVAIGVAVQTFLKVKLHRKA